MVNPSAIQKARDGKRAALEKVYAVMVVHEPRITTDTDMANLVQCPKQDVRNLRYDLERVGSLTTKRVPQGRQGISNEWTLTDTLDTARRKLNDQWAADDKVTKERVAAIPHPGAPRKAKAAGKGWTNGAGHLNIRQASLSEVVAVSGAEAPKPMAALAPERYDEPRALVEAARQYAGLHKQVEAKVKELEALGITVDRERLGKAVQLPADPRLGAVAQAMPYIEHLERANERLSGQVVDLREKVGNLPELNQRLSRLHAQNERLVAEKLELQRRLDNRPAPAAPRPVGPGRPEPVTAGN